MTGSNRRPPACKAGALPAELIPLRLRNPALPGQLHSTLYNLPSRLVLLAVSPLDDDGGSGWVRTIDPRLIKTVL